MIKVTAGGRDAFSAYLKAGIVSIDVYLSLEFTGWTKRVFKDLVVHTPQWSGDAASNWMYSINSANSDYQPLPDKADMWPPYEMLNGGGEPYRRGSSKAVNVAMERMKGERTAHWRESVFFTNSAPIAGELGNMTDQLRPVNLVNGVVATASYIALKHMNLPV